jgi:hypothetical protein
VHNQYRRCAFDTSMANGRGVWLLQRRRYAVGKLHHPPRSVRCQSALRLACETVVRKFWQPDLSFHDRPLVLAVLAHDPIVRLAINRREQPKDGVAPGRKAGRRWHNGLINLEAVISHDEHLQYGRRGYGRCAFPRTGGCYAGLADRLLRSESSFAPKAGGANSQWYA